MNPRRAVVVVSTWDITGKKQLESTESALLDIRAIPEFWTYRRRYLNAWVPAATSSMSVPFKTMSKLCLSFDWLSSLLMIVRNGIEELCKKSGCFRGIWEFRGCGERKKKGVRSWENETYPKRRQGTSVENFERTPHFGLGDDKPSKFQKTLASVLKPSPPLTQPEDHLTAEAPLLTKTTTTPNSSTSLRCFTLTLLHLVPSSISQTAHFVDFYRAMV